MFANYTEISAKEVVDKHNRIIDDPYDFLIKLGGAYPLVTTLVLSRGRFKKEFAAVPWGNVRKVNDQIHLNISEEQLVFKEVYENGEETSIRKAVLDQQVVDTFNRKVVRVNDVHFLRVGKDLRVAHVDVGFRALVRRLGWEGFVDSLVGSVKPRARYLTRDNFISWKFVQPLEVEEKRGKLKLNVPHEDLVSIPPADLSEILEELDPQEKIALFRSFDFDTQVDVLNEMEVEEQQELMEELDTTTTIKLIEEMDADEAADLLGEVSKKEATRILSLMRPAKARKIYSLLKYESDSAGGLMMTDFIRLNPSMTVGDAISKIRALELDSEMVYYAYVLDDEERLVGKITFKQILQAEQDMKLSEIMVKRLIKVFVETDAKEVAYLMEKYDLLAIPVVNEKSVMKGLITIDDILAMVIDETWGEKPGLL